MKAQFQITEDDYVSAMKLHGWRQLARPSALLLTLGAIVIAMLIIILLQPGGTIPAVFVAVAFVAIFPASIFILGPLRTRWHYRHSFRNP